MTGVGPRANILQLVEQVSRDRHVRLSLKYNREISAPQADLKNINPRNRAAIDSATEPRT